MRDGRLSARVSLPEEARKAAEKDFPSSHPVRVSMRESDLVWSVKCYGETVQKQTVALACYDTEALAPFQCLALHVGPESTKLYAAAFDGPAAQSKLELTQDAKGITYAWLLPGDTQEQRGQVASLAELRRRHRAAVERYVLPAMRRIGLRGFARRHPADEVYTAFASLQPDPGIAGQLAALLPRLALPRVAEREAASDELARLGRPGALAMLRLDRGPLATEQNLRLDLFLKNLGDELPRQPAEPELDFYLDCLDDEDLQVRTAAKAALEAKLARPIEFDATLEADPRSVAVDRIYEQLDRAAPETPTTRPAR
jgi:hypothetical protein